MISFTEPRQGCISLFSSSNTVLIFCTVSQRSDDKRLVFFPLQSTLRKLCFIKFSMPGNLQYLIVYLVFLLIFAKWDQMFAKNNGNDFSKSIGIFLGVCCINLKKLIA